MEINTKAKIALAAAELFKEYGYENVSIGQICKQLGVTRNAFYYNFSSKDELLANYFESFFSESEDILVQLLTIPNDWDKLKKLITVHLEQVEKLDHELCMRYITASVKMNFGIIGDYFLTEKICIPLIESCQKQGIIKTKGTPQEINRILMAYIIGAVLKWCAQEGRFSLKEEVVGSVRCILQIEE